jgi:hypothetical protein
MALQAKLTQNPCPTDPVFTSAHGLDDIELIELILVLRQYLHHSTGIFRLKLIVVPTPNHFFLHVHRSRVTPIPTFVWGQYDPIPTPEQDIDTEIEIIHATANIPTKTQSFRLSIVASYSIGIDGVTPIISVYHKVYKMCKPFSGYINSLPDNYAKLQEKFYVV